MRRSLPLLVVLLTTVTACGGVADDSVPPPDSTATETVSNAADADLSTEMRSQPGRPSREAGPTIGPETAPGVAFNYRYSFRLDADRVAEAQQEHQRLCERLTVNRCRITGMVYRAANDQDVEAMLSLRVDPAIAGQFGRESVQAVVNADGELTDSEITGTDMGSTIDASGRTLAELTSRLEQIEARIRSARDSDKGQLEYEAEALRQQIRDLRNTREGQQRSLATTPMLFRYGSGDLAPGPAEPPSLRNALRETGDDFMSSLILLLVVLVRLLPWGVAALLVWGVWRIVRHRLAHAPAPPAAEPALDN